MWVKPCLTRGGLRRYTRFRSAVIVAQHRSETSRNRWAANCARQINHRVNSAQSLVKRNRILLRQLRDNSTAGRPFRVPLCCSIARISHSIEAQREFERAARAERNHRPRLRVSQEFPFFLLVSIRARFAADTYLNSFLLRKKSAPRSRNQCARVSCLRSGEINCAELTRTLVAAGSMIVDFTIP